MTKNEIRRWFLLTIGFVCMNGNHHYAQYMATTAFTLVIALWAIKNED